MMDEEEGERRRGRRRRKRRRRRKGFICYQKCTRRLRTNEV
jgi:hypothetical protein